MFASLLLLLAAEGAAGAPAVEIDEPNPKEMSRSEIAKFNEQVSKTHPYYIRCVRQQETGSLVKKSYSCRTNEKWQLADRTGGQDARDTLGDLQRRGGTNGN